MFQAVIAVTECRDVTTTLQSMRATDLPTETKAQMFSLKHKWRRHCTKCAPGYGIVELCTPRSDTVCKKCADGTFSPHHSSRHPCFVCSRCGDGLYELQPCGGGHDVTCDACDNGAAALRRKRVTLATLRKYVDFSRKCSRLPVTEPETRDTFKRDEEEYEE